MGLLVRRGNPADDAAEGRADGQEDRAMTTRPTGLRRRTLLKSTIAAALPMPAIAQDMRAKTLRFIPSANLSFIDPSISTAGVSIDHGFAVFDCLYGVDAKNQPKPQMVEGHTVSDDLRTWTFRHGSNRRCGS